MLVLKAPLLYALDIATPLLKKGSILPITENVHIFDGKLHAVSLSAGHVIVPDAMPKEFPEVLLPAEDLKKVLGACKEDEVDISIQMKGALQTVLIKFGKTKISLPISDPAEAFPKIPEIQGEASIVPGNVMQEVLLKLGKMANKYVAAGVQSSHENLFFDGEQFISSSLAGVFVYKIPEGALPVLRKAPMCIDYKVLSIIRSGGVNEPVTLTSNGLMWGETQYILQKGTAEPKSVGAMYAQVLGVFGDLNDFMKMETTAEELKGAITICQLASKDATTPYARVKLRENVLIFTGHGEGFETTGEAHVRLSVPLDEKAEFDFALNLSTFPEIFNALAGDRVIFCVKKGFAHLPVYFDDAQAMLSGFLAPAE